MRLTPLNHSLLNLKPDFILALLRNCLLLAAAAFILLLVYTIWNRITYPGELELIEGSVVRHVWEAMQGHALYAKPTFEFAANLYTPLFYYAAAALSYFVNAGFFSVRLLSVLATAGVIMLCGRFVYRETGNHSAAWMASGLYAASYAASGAWMDLARVDSFMVFWLVLAFYIVRFARGSSGLLLGATCMLFAVMSKQSAMVAAPALMMFLFLFPATSSPRWIAPLGVSALLVAVLGMLDLFTDHWFSYYTVLIPLGHPNNGKHLTEFFQFDLLAVVPVLLAITLALFVWLWQKNQIRQLGFYLLFFAGCFVQALLTRYNKGGVYNNLMPLHACLAILAGIAAASWLWRESSQYIFGKIIFAVALLIQFVMLGYVPSDYIPTQQQRQDQLQLLDDVRKLPGNVFGGDLGFIGHQIGKQDFIHNTAIGDIDLSSNKRWKNTGLDFTLAGRTKFMLDGLVAHDIRCLLVVSEEGHAPDNTIGPFHSQKFYALASRHEPHPWFIRSWPARTYFAPPAVAVYIKQN